MVHAFVMVATGVATSQGIVEQIREFETVTEAHIVAGQYDIIAELDTEEVYDVLRTTTTDIQGLEGVEDTKTYISMED
ncbi:Lrp/AsnC ligand binding domain-containing protein [Haloferacaceae archaeon DSL9]